MTVKTSILAIDTSTGPCSVAVWKDGGVAAYLENLKPSQQSACLMPMVEEVLAKAAIGYKDLAAVACTTGPGSFTGIRVGLASARGICFAGKIKALGFTTLEVMAFANDSAPTLAILNAGKGEVYFQAFRDHQALYEPKVGCVEDALASLPGAVVASNMNIRMNGYLTSAVTFPRADLLAMLAAKRPDAAKPMQPFYIRDPDAKPMKVDS